MNAQQKDRLTGLLGMIGASIYVYQASLIEDSLLADAVGVTGVPTAIGALLGAAAVLLFLKSWLPSKAPATSESEEAPSLAAVTTRTLKPWACWPSCLVLWHWFRFSVSFSALVSWWRSLLILAARASSKL